MYLPHADSVGNYCENPEPDGNVVLVIKVINAPHDESDYYDPFEPHNVLRIDIPGEHGSGDYRKPGYGIRGYGGDRKSGLQNNKDHFDDRGAVPF